MVKDCYGAGVAAGTTMVASHRIGAWLPSCLGALRLRLARHRRGEGGYKEHDEIRLRGFSTGGHVRASPCHGRFRSLVSKEIGPFVPEAPLSKLQYAKSLMDARGIDISSCPISVCDTVSTH